MHFKAMGMRELSFEEDKQGIRKVLYNFADSALLNNCTRKAKEDSARLIQRLVYLNGRLLKWEKEDFLGKEKLCKIFVNFFF